MNRPLASRRREIGRDLTRVAEASVEKVLLELESGGPGTSVRIGVTGPPGSGKSTLIGGLATRRLRRWPDNLLAILAIDPSSAVSNGSILGDRIRLDALANEPNVFVRSVPGRRTRDGLCNNVIDLLAVLEGHGFAEIILETVGTGQSEVDVQELVDTLILIIPPDAGNSVQAMKAGVMEIATIYVVSKAERPEAKRMAAEIRSVLGFSRPRPDAWRPPVILTDSSGKGIDELDAAIESHAAHVAATADRDEIAVRRRLYHLRTLAARRTLERLALDPKGFQGRLSDAFGRLASQLALSDPEGGAP